MKIIPIIALTITTLILYSCLKKEPSFVVVENFEIENYLGKWYEIARLDHSFERGMSNVTAEYELKSNGTIKVLNKGKKKNGKWSSAVGKAKLRSDANKGALKVSFFGPFYGAYNIVALDKNYENALILGDGTDYCWILSRSKKMDQTVLNDYVAKAKKLGVDTNALIYVKQD